MTGPPRYRSTQNADKQLSGTYTALGDDWGLELFMPGLDEVSIDNSLAVGNAAQIRFGTASGYGDPLPVKVGDTNWSDLKKKSDGELCYVQFRNQIRGTVAQINVEVWGA